MLEKVLRSAPLQRVVGPDFAVDLGTSTFRVVSSFGLRVDEPLCESESAMSRGTVADTDRASRILQDVFARARRVGLRRPRVVISYPSDVTAGERNDFLSVARNAGASRVAAFPEPLAAAVGSGIDIASGHAQMIVDIGHGVTDGIIVREGEVVERRSVRTGCGDLQRTTIEQAATLGIRLSRAEAVALLERFADGGTPVVGSIPCRMFPELFRLLADVSSRWLETVAAVPLALFRDAPDTVGAELIESGLWVTGGGALLPEVVPAIIRRTGLDVRRVPDPLSAVVVGNRGLLATADRFDSWF